MSFVWGCLICSRSSKSPLKMLNIKTLEVVMKLPKNSISVAYSVSVEGMCAKVNPPLKIQTFQFYTVQKSSKCWKIKTWSECHYPSVIWLCDFLIPHWPEHTWLMQIAENDIITRWCDYASVPIPHQRDDTRFSYYLRFRGTFWSSSTSAPLNFF